VLVPLLLLGCGFVSSCTLLLSSGVVASFARDPSVTLGIRVVFFVSLGLFSDQISVRTMI